MTTDLSRLSDGTYGRELGRVSPEGNIYGTTRWVRDVLRNFWWNGAKWLEVGEDIGQSNSVQLLPTTPQEPDTVWRCLDRYETDRSRYVWKYFFWDAETQGWLPIVWHWTVDSVQELDSIEPWFRGQAHEVKEPDVQAMWDGYTWRRIRISSLDDDIGIVSTLALYGGTLQGLSPEVELVFISPKELSLRPINSDFDYTTINGIIVDSSRTASVYTVTPVLDWWDESESYSLSTLQHSSEGSPRTYWVYLANKNEAFALSTYDYRGRLFCSTTAPINNRLGRIGSSAYNAMLVGRCQTAIPNDPSEDIRFLYELDVSTISMSSDLKETFREFSDFNLEWVDEENLALSRIYGTRGQIFVAGALYYIGEGLTLNIDDTRIFVNRDKTLTFQYSADPLVDPLNDDDLYYIYLASASDIWNDNEINPENNRPWHPEDDGAGDGISGPYYAVKDLRLKLFLSTKIPEDGRLSETYYGYWSRHVGQVRADATSKFIFSPSISAIRQPTLNPEFLGGLAEISILANAVDNIKVVRKTGTSGILMVGGQGVALYDDGDINVHTINDKASVYIYTPSRTIIDSGKNANHYLSRYLNLYMTNAHDFWDDNKEALLFFENEPVNGYLDDSFPGNNARFIASVRISQNDLGPELITNGTFETDSGWSKRSNWYYSDNDKAVYHTPISGTIDSWIGRQIDTSGWQSFTNATISQTTVGNEIPSQIYHAVSFDGGTNWKINSNNIWTAIVRIYNNTWQYLSGGSWTNAPINTLGSALSSATSAIQYQWTKSSVEALDATAWMNANGWNSSDTIDWVYRLVDGIQATYSSDYATPNTSIDTSARSKCFASSYYPQSGDPHAPFRAFQQNATSIGQGWSAYYSAYSFPHSLGYNFGSNLIIDRYQLTSVALGGSGYAYPREYYFQGSLDTTNGNDGTWVNLHHHETGWSDGYSGLLRTYTSPPLGNLVAYKAYRFSFLSSNGDWLFVKDVKLMSAVKQTVTPSVTSVAFRGIIGSISQVLQPDAITVEPNTLYRVSIRALSVSGGNLSVSIGGQDAGEITSLGYHVLVVEAIDNTPLQITAQNATNTILDNISVREVINANIGQSTIRNSIASIPLLIDDSIESVTDTWSSSRIAQEIAYQIISYNEGGGLFERQKTAGLPVKLAFQNSQSVNLSCPNKTTRVVFEDESSIDVSPSGFSLTVSGSPNVLYYVYLNKDGLFQSTTPPNRIFLNMQCLGSTSIFVGYVGFASTNIMEGSWNVFGSYNQPTQTFTVTDGTEVIIATSQDRQPGGLNYSPLFSYTLDNFLRGLVFGPNTKLTLQNIPLPRVEWIDKRGVMVYASVPLGESGSLSGYGPDLVVRSLQSVPSNWANYVELSCIINYLLGTGIVFMSNTVEISRETGSYLNPLNITYNVSNMESMGTQASFVGPWAFIYKIKSTNFTITRQGNI